MAYQEKKMTTLDHIKEQLKYLRNEILCQDIGNDTYYSSPLYHEHLLKLAELETEEQFLEGKIPADILKNNIRIYEVKKNSEKN